MNIKILFFVIIILIVGARHAVPLQAQEPVLDTVWMRYTHDITRLEFSNDDSKILTVGSGGIIIFDTQTGNQLKQLPGYLDAEYSSDYNLIFAVRDTADSDNHIFPIVDAVSSSSYEKIKTIKLPKLSYQPGYSKIAVSTDYKTIVVGSILGLFFIDYQSGELKKFMDKFGNEERPTLVGNFLFSKDGKDLIISLSFDNGHGDYDGGLMFIDVNTYDINYRNDNVGGLLSMSDDGTLLASGTSLTGKAVAVMNTQTHEIINSIPGNVSGVAGIEFSKDNKYLAITGLVDGYTTNIFDMFNLSVKKSFQNMGPFRGGMDFYQDNKYFLVAATSYMVLFNFITTGIQEPNENIELLYPNPTDNTVIISFNLQVSSQLIFNLYDMNGILISNFKNQFYEQGLISENFILSNLANGSYYLKIESLQFNKTFKIIINK